jgi:hypothetical protein
MLLKLRYKHAGYGAGVIVEPVRKPVENCK